MTKENAKDYLPLVQALADGKSIQVTNGKSWEDCDDIGFHLAPTEYRIKPEPREWSVGLSRDGRIMGSVDKEIVGGVADRIIRVREVIE